MLAVGGLQPPPPPPPSVPPCAKPGVSRKSVFGANTFSVLSIKNCKTYFTAFPLPSPASSLSVGRSRLCLFAQNRLKNGGTAVLESIEVYEEEEEEGEEEDDDFDFEDDDNEDENDDLNVIVPIEELDEWLRRKPRGFGEGKVYDTSIEDKLVEEIEQGRKAQLANIKKLKSLSLEQLNKDAADAEAASTGACVRISQLPKKRNIERDLKTAFKGIAGIVNIKPLVLGNKKTKDPICKGLAYVNFNTLEDAKRFMDIISRKNITFGKIEKQIKCELMNSMYNPSQKTVKNTNVEAKNKADSDGKSGLLLLDDEVDSEDDSEEAWDTDSADEDDGDEDVGESFKSLSISKLDNIERIEQKMMSSVVSLQSKHGDNPQAAVKLKPARKKSEKKNTMAKIPGGEKRLKVQEKAMLADSGDEDEDMRESFKSLSASNLDDIERIEQKLMSSAVSLPSKHADNPQAAAKVESAQKKSEKKNTVAKIPRAEKRLNLQEAAMLLLADSGDEDEDVIESNKSLSASNLDDIELIEQKLISSAVSLPLKHADNPQAAVKLKSSQKKTEKKNTVAKIPVAEKRLKLQEKAMLADSGDEDEDVRESIESLSTLKLDDIEQIDVSVPLKHGDNNPQAAVKVKSARKKSEKKNTVAKIPGATKRLKLREKAMLADVLSRYGSRVASASTES